MLKLYEMKRITIDTLIQACQTGGPRAACGPIACFVRPEWGFNLFCAARIGLLFSNNSFILLIFSNFQHKFVFKSPILGTKNTVKLFLTTKFCKMRPAYDYFITFAAPPAVFDAFAARKVV